MSRKTMLDWALAYAALGWKVFPLRTTGDLKRPNGILGGVGEGSGHLKATTDPKQIRAWWAVVPNAGIAVHLAASGLCAVDTDPKDNGPAKLKALETRFGRLETPVEAVSGSGGAHRLFGAPKGSYLPGKVHGEVGVDIKYNGYIVLAPSPHSAGKPPKPTGKNYRWAEGKSPFDEDNYVFIPNFPEWIAQGGDSLPARVGGRVDPEDVFANDRQRAGLSVEQISDMLAVVSNEEDDIDYDAWFNIIAGIWHETNGSAEGKALALDWSRQNLKHDESKFERSWKSADHEGKGQTPITIRYLIKLASAAKKRIAVEQFEGLMERLKVAPSAKALREICTDIKKTALDPVDRSDLRSVLQKKHKALTENTLSMKDARDLTRYEDPNANVMPKWLEGWSYVSTEDMFIKLRSNAVMSKSAFDNYYNVKMITDQERLEGKSYPEETASNAALNRFVVPRAERRMYLPGEDDTFTFNGQTCFNTFSDAQQPAVPETLSATDKRAVTVLERHFAHIAEDERERGLLVSWLAYIVQTNQRSNWAIVIQSLEGEGKSFLQTLMGCVLGASNVGVLVSETIQDSFTIWAAGSMLKVVEEIKMHGMHRFDILDKLKTYVSNPDITVRDMHKAPAQIINTASYLMFTNYRDALPVDERDTRYFLIASARQTVEQVQAFKNAHPGYYDRLFAIVNESPGAMRHYFLNYELHPEFSPTARAPHSREKATIAYMNKTDLQHDVEELLTESGNPALSKTLLDVTLMGDLIVEQGGTLPAGKSVQALLLKLGFQSLGRFRVEGRVRYYYSMTPNRFGKSGDKLTGQAIREYLDKFSTNDL